MPVVYASESCGTRDVAGAIVSQPRSGDHGAAISNFQQLAAQRSVFSRALAADRSGIARATSGNGA
jgi:hypothetical protein